MGPQAQGRPGPGRPGLGCPHLPGGAQAHLHHPPAPPLLLSFFPSFSSPLLLHLEMEQFLLLLHLHLHLHLHLARTDHYVAAWRDKGWGCGFWNLQYLLLSCLLHSTLYRCSTCSCSCSCTLLH